MSSVTATGPKPFGDLMGHIMCSQEQIGYDQVEQRFVLINRERSFFFLNRVDGPGDMPNISLDLKIIATKMHSLILDTLYELDFKAVIHLNENIGRFNLTLMGSRATFCLRVPSLTTVIVKPIFVKDKQELNNLFNFLEKNPNAFSFHATRQAILQFVDELDVSPLTRKELKFLISIISSLYNSQRETGSNNPKSREGFKSITHMLAEQPYELLTMNNDSLSLYINSSLLNLDYSDLSSLECLSIFLKSQMSNRKSLKKFPAIYKQMHSGWVSKTIDVIQNLVEKRYTELKNILAGLDIFPSELQDLIHSYSTGSEFLTGIISAHLRDYITPAQDADQSDSRSKTYAILHTFSKHNPISVDPVIQYLFSQASSLRTLFIKNARNTYSVWINEPDFMQKAVKAFMSQTPEEQPFFQEINDLLQVKTASESDNQQEIVKAMNFVTHYPKYNASLLPYYRTLVEKYHMSSLTPQQKKAIQKITVT